MRLALWGLAMSGCATVGANRVARAQRVSSMFEGSRARAVECDERKVDQQLGGVESGSEAPTKNMPITGSRQAVVGGVRCQERELIRPQFND